MTDKEKLRAAWVAALRSGDYKQGKKALFTEGEGGYCCLGVAGKILGKSDDDLAGYNKLHAYDSFLINQIYFEIAKAFGLRESLGHYKGGSLFIHNDRDNWTFDQIADLIESKPKGLFVDE